MWLMTIYIALLRGVNVGGKNRIKMAELRRTLEELGLCQVQTYIQSGNVLFQSEDEEETLRKRIEHAIEVACGFPVTVVLRTAGELQRVAANCPFSEQAVAAAEASSEGECLYVAFLLAEPAPEGVERLLTFQGESDEYRIDGREVYLMFSRGVRNSKLASNLHQLRVPATVRNWKTVNKLLALAQEMLV